MDKQTYQGKCPTCGQGTIRPTRVQNHKTRIKGRPFTVPEAVIGVCDQCDERLYPAQELKRWQRLYEEDLERRGALLGAADIAALREQLGLGTTDFARLIGATKPSIYNWENVERTKGQARNIDLLLKLVQASLERGEVDVIDLLLAEAKKWGAEIELQRPAMAE